MLMRSRRGGQSLTARRSRVAAVGWAGWLTLLLLVAPAFALDHITLKRDGKITRVSGQVVTEAQDGGVLLLDREGVLWAVPGAELVERTADVSPFEPLRQEALKAKLLKELPAGFQTHTTAHYLIFYNASSAYAQWCGTLYERLYRAFHTYWENRGFELHDPPMPLVAIVFDTKTAYERYARPELGDAVANIVSYYNLQSNRIVMYDLTGSKTLAGGGGRLTTTAQINRLLLQPGAESMVANIIHEAVHQLAYNDGLHSRFADIPLWVSEGLAVYFETPDLRSSKGWNDIGGVNRGRLQQFHQYVRNRPADSLRTLIQDDKRFRQPKTALDAYAEAWSLNYYLIHKRPKDYVRYLQILAQKKPLFYDTPDERWQAFASVFGESTATLDTDFVRYMAGVR